MVSKEQFDKKMDDYIDTYVQTSWVDRGLLPISIKQENALREYIHNNNQDKRLIALVEGDYRIDEYELISDIFLNEVLYKEDPSKANLIKCLLFTDDNGNNLPESNYRNAIDHNYIGIKNILMTSHKPDLDGERHYESIFMGSRNKLTNSDFLESVLDFLEVHTEWGVGCADVHPAFWLVNADFIKQYVNNDGSKNIVIPPKDME